jgi:electron transport complex protein RnfB
MPDMLRNAQAPHGLITDGLMVRRADSPGQSENQDRDGVVESVRAHHCRPRRTRRYCDAMPTTANAPQALIERIDACLPQTQCTQCGYPRCRAYAEALAAGSAGINQCPPGGDVTIRALSALLHATPQPLDPRFGSHKPRARAVIDETLCIGCRKCIDACPVDAIIGARKLMHTVIARECTGCELCLPPCPVDCIAMMPDHTEHARSASGSDHTKPPLPQRGRGVGERESSPLRGRRDGGVTDVRWVSGASRECPARDGRAGLQAEQGLRSAKSVPSSGCAGSSRTPAGINEGEGARAAELWLEYTDAETARWRRRTEKRLERLARTRRARRRNPSDNAVTTAATTPLLPNDREKIRAEISAAIERVKAKKHK